MPLRFQDGLCYINEMRPTTDEELGTLPYVIFTSDVPWDPTMYDDDDVGWQDCLEANDKEDNKKFTIFEDGREDYFDSCGENLKTRQIHFSTHK